MISDENLIKFHEEGFVPGPNETEKAFLKRIETTKLFFENPHNYLKDNGLFDFFDQKASSAYLDWVKIRLKELFDVNPKYFCYFFKNKKLSFFQAAATWIIEKPDFRLPIVQLKTQLKKKRYLLFYSIDEILLHEAVHAARINFDEPNSEEYFAFSGSSSLIRRTLGPVIKNSKEVWVFFSLIGLGYVSLLLFPGAAVGAFLLAIMWASLGLFRLFFIRNNLYRAYRKLLKIASSRKLARYILFRLTDREIKFFAKKSFKEMIEYIQSEATSSLRWRVIKLKYLKQFV